MSFASALQLILRRAWDISRPWRNRQALRYIRSFDPRLPSPRIPTQGAFILRLLEAHRPKSIVELGSGDSTIWFAAYAAKAGAEFTSFDQSAGYQGFAERRHHRPSVAEQATSGPHDRARDH